MAVEFDAYEQIVIEQAVRDYKEVLEMCEPVEESTIKTRDSMLVLCISVLDKLNTEKACAERGAQYIEDICREDRG